MTNIEVRPATPLYAANLRDARLYATRIDMLRAMPVKPGGRVAEIGVGTGEFSEVIVTALKPKELAAFDLFQMHTLTECWGIPTKTLFDAMTHRDFYERRLSRLPVKIDIHAGSSEETLAKCDSDIFDFIYVDARHDYESICADIKECTRLIKHDGVLIFNDYTFYDPYLKTPYGVVQAVNELVTSSNWKIIGMSLDKNMFCDIALRR